MAHSFNPAAYAAIPIEDVSFITDLRDDAVATYNPANSQEVFACERIALAQASLSRCAMLEAGFHTAFMLPDPVGPAVEAIDAQNQSLSLATGFSRTSDESDAFKLFLRYRDQCRREYRDARQDIVQLIKLRGTLDQPAVAVPEPSSPPVAEDTPLTLTSIPHVRNAPREGPPQKDLYVLHPRFATHPPVDEFPSSTTSPHSTLTGPDPVRSGGNEMVRGEGKFWPPMNADERG